MSKKPVITDKDGTVLNAAPSSLQSLVDANARQKLTRPTLTEIWTHCTNERLTFDHFTTIAIHNKYQRQELVVWLENTNFRGGTENGKHYCCGFHEPDA